MVIGNFHEQIRNKEGFYKKINPGKTTDLSFRNSAVLGRQLEIFMNKSEIRKGFIKKNPGKTTDLSFRNSAVLGRQLEVFMNKSEIRKGFLKKLTGHKSPRKKSTCCFT